MLKALKEPQREAFSKESDMVKVARWAYQKAHHANVEGGIVQSLCSFHQMATSTNLPGTEVHEVQESCGDQKDLRAIKQAARAFPKDIHFFQIILPTESLKIMGLHSSEALQ